MKKRMSKLLFISSSLFGLFFVKTVSAASFDTKMFDHIFSISSKESKRKSTQSNTPVSFDFSFFNNFNNNSNNTIPQSNYGVKSLPSVFADFFNFSTTNKVISAPVTTTASSNFADFFNFSTTNKVVPAPFKALASSSFGDFFNLNTTNTAAAVPASVTTTASSSFADFFTTSNTTNTTAAVPAPVKITTSSSFADFFNFNTPNTTAAVPAPVITTASSNFADFFTTSNTTNTTAAVPAPVITTASSNFADFFTTSNTIDTPATVAAPVTTTAFSDFADFFTSLNTANTTAAVPVPVNTPASLGFGDLFTTSNTTNTPAAVPATVNMTASSSFADLFNFDTPVRETEQDRIASEQQQIEEAEQDRIASEQQQIEEAEQDRIASEQQQIEEAEQDRIASEQQQIEEAEQNRIAVQDHIVEAERVRVEIAESLRQNEERFAAEREEDARINLEVLRREEARIAAEILAAQEAENAPINAFLAQNLENGRSFSGEFHKTLIQTPEYQGISNLYPGSEYPKIPRFHPYHPQFNHTYLSLEIPKTFFSNDHLHQIFGNIPDENIKIFLLAQDNSENNILFRPHYYIDSDIPDGDLAYNSNKEVSVSIFNLGGTPGTFKDGVGNNVEEGIFFRSAISTHPSNLGDQQPDGTFVPDIPALVASPGNFPIDGFIKQQGALLASVVTGPTTDGTQVKGALTFHYFPSQENNNEFGWPNNDTLNNRIAIANTVQEGLIALPIDPNLHFDMDDFRYTVGEIARTIQNARHDHDEE